MKAYSDTEIDSSCFAPDPDDPDDRCGADATTWVHTPRGIDRYLCEDHAADVDRFGDTDADHPTAVACDRCRRMTPVGHAERVSDDDHDRLCPDCRE